MDPRFRGGDNLLALPGVAAEALAPRAHRDAAPGELVHLLAHLAPHVLGQVRRRLVEAREYVVVGRGGAVVEEAAALVPDQRALGRVGAVAELEQGHLPAGLPD